MLQSPSSNEADRIALTNMFKAIAAYGRKVRQRRQADLAQAAPREQSRAKDTGQASLNYKRRRQKRKDSEKNDGV